MTLTVNSDLNGASPQFTLTCISTGGPATNVTWTRDSEMLTGSTVLNNAETAQYTHTLTVTGRLGGLYTCTVANDKPSSTSSTYSVEGMKLKHSSMYKELSYQCWLSATVTFSLSSGLVVTLLLLQIPPLPLL